MLWRDDWSSITHRRPVGWRGLGLRFDTRNPCNTFDFRVADKVVHRDSKKLHCVHGYTRSFSRFFASLFSQIYLVWKYSESTSRQILQYKKNFWGTKKIYEQNSQLLQALLTFDKTVGIHEVLISGALPWVHSHISVKSMLCFSLMAAIINIFFRNPKTSHWDVTENHAEAAYEI